MVISQNKLGREIGVPPRRINEIVLGKRAITADTALRLARYFGVSEGFWMGLQADFDLENTRLQLGDRLDNEVRPHVANKARDAGQGSRDAEGEIPKEGG